MFSEDLEVSEMSRREALRSYQSATTSSRPLADASTKRSCPSPCIPLSTISDGEESENSREPVTGTGIGASGPTGATPSFRGLKLDLSRRRESPSPRGKRETPSPQTQGSFTNAFKVIRPRQSPRTTVSLDAVDLWEDDDDSDGSEFDEINGVVINPCKTFDFSELSRSRSPVACKRNKLDCKKPSVAENLKLSIKRLDSQEKVSSAKSSGKVSPGRVSPGRRKSPRELRAWKPRPRIAGRHKNIFPDPEPEPSSAGPEQHTARTDLTNSLTKSIDGHLPTNTQEQIPPKEPSLKNGKILNKRLSLLRSKTDFSLHRLKEEVEIVSDSADETDSLNSTGERRVKFNNLVSVRDGELNTVDSLRNSNNSAMMYKKQYLVPQGWREELPDLSGRSLHA